jgi:hypothetical protein
MWLKKRVDVLDDELDVMLEDDGGKDAGGDDSPTNNPVETPPLH